MYIFRVGLYYFGTGEVGEVKGFNSLFDYSRDNKLKFGILNVKGKASLKLLKKLMLRTCRNSLVCSGTSFVLNGNYM